MPYSDARARGVQIPIGLPPRPVRSNCRRR